MLPQMIPLQMRNQGEGNDLRAQSQYSPFRTTEFSARKDELEAKRGPGALFTEEWNALAVHAQKRNLSLYRNDRDVNPTPVAAVQEIYDAHESHDLALHIRKRGNAVTALKSSTPRFTNSGESPTGPGTYSPERYHGAFPALLEKVTPREAQREKQHEKARFEEALAIIPANSPRKTYGKSVTGCSQVSSPRSPSKIAPLRSFPLSDCSPRELLPRPNEAIGSFNCARLKASLTAKNAYHDQKHRQLVLASQPCSNEPHSLRSSMK